MRFQISKNGQNLDANMEGFRRASHIYIPFTYARKGTLQHILYYVICFLGSLALGKHFIQAFPSVYTLQCLTGKVDNK